MEVYKTCDSKHNFYIITEKKNTLPNKWAEGPSKQHVETKFKIIFWFKYF